MANGTVRRPKTRDLVRAETVPGQRGGRQRPTTLFELPTVGRVDTEDVSVFRGQETLAGHARTDATGRREAPLGRRHGETSAAAEPAGQPRAGRVRRVEIRGRVRAADVAGQEPDAGATGMVHDVAVRHRVRATDVPGDGGYADGPPGVPAGQTVGGAHPKSVPRLRGQARVAGRPGPVGSRPGGADPRGRRDQAGPATSIAGHRRPASLRAAETGGGGRSAPIPGHRGGANATRSVPVAQAQRVGVAAAIPGQPRRETLPWPVRAT